MTRRMLPPLANRSTRVRLLAWTLEDAMTGGTLDGGGPDANASRMMLHGELWPAGSYQELDRALGLLTGGQRRVFTVAHVDVARPFQSREWETLAAVGMLMPANIFVPPSVSEAAGFLPTEAKTFAMPRGELSRRRARTFRSVA